MRGRLGNSGYFSVGLLLSLVPHLSPSFSISLFFLSLSLSYSCLSLSLRKNSKPKRWSGEEDAAGEECSDIHDG